MEEKSLVFPYEFSEYTPEETTEFNKVYPSPLSDRIRVGPKGYSVGRPYKHVAADIYNLPVRSSDIFVTSYQRSGTTWTQELVWLLANDFDYESAENITLTKRYNFLDQFMFVDKARIDPFVESLSTQVDINKDIVKQLLMQRSEPATIRLAAAPSSPSPRFIKTHLPLSLLPPHILNLAKVVYVARDPRDVAVSSYHQGKLFKWMGLEGNFKQVWKLFQHDLFVLTPYFEHVKEAWDKRDEPNMLFLFYEDMLKDLPGTVNRVANFLGKQVNADQMHKLCDHLSINKFRVNKSVNFEEFSNTGLLGSGEQFIRKGVAGGWRAYFDEEMTQEAEQWIRDNLRDTDLRFPTIDVDKLS